MPDPQVRSRFVDPAIAEYAARHTTPPDPVQVDLRARTLDRYPDAAGMQVGDDQFVLLEVLARATGARSVVEVGTFTGHSSLALARGVGPEGRLLCCDVSEEWTALARDAWRAAGVEDRIELRIGPALDTLRSLPADVRFDLAFVDADKPGYVDYYRELMPRLRPGGLLVADNTLMGGGVLDGDRAEGNAAAIHAFNEVVAADPTVVTVLLPFADGLTLVQRR
ncbi:MAG: O-methyltransferase [Acidimicrobiia bacterium]